MLKREKPARDMRMVYGAGGDLYSYHPSLLRYWYYSCQVYPKEEADAIELAVPSNRTKRRQVSRSREHLLSVL